LRPAINWASAEGVLDSVEATEVEEEELVDDEVGAGFGSFFLNQFHIEEECVG
jgi:hypothetical protein